MAAPQRFNSLREEDELYRTAIEISIVHGGNVKTIYVMLMMDQMFDNFQLAARFLATMAKLLLRNVLPSFSIQEAWPEDSFFTELNNFSDGPLFGDLVNEESFDTYEHLDENGEGTGQYWPAYKWIDGACNTVGILAMAVIAFFGGRFAIRHLKSAWSKDTVEKAGTVGALSALAASLSRATNNTADVYNVTKGDNIDESTTLTTIVNQLVGTSVDSPKAISAEGAFMNEGLRLLTRALDSNSNIDKDKLVKYITSMADGTEGTNLV